MSGYIDIPVHLDATIRYVAGLADCGQRRVHEEAHSLDTSPGSYRWVRSNMTPQADLVQNYASYFDFYHRLTDDCHALEAEAFRRILLDPSDFFCHDVEIYVYWNGDNFSAIDQVGQDDWSSTVTKMNKRFDYWNRSGMERVSFYVKRIYSPIGTLIVQSLFDL